MAVARTRLELSTNTQSDDSCLGVLQGTTSAGPACAWPCSTSGSVRTAGRSSRRPAVSHTRARIACFDLVKSTHCQRHADKPARQYTSPSNRSPLSSQSTACALPGATDQAALHRTTPHGLRAPAHPPPCTCAGWQPKINTALWNTVQLLFPQHAAEAPPPTPPGATQPAAAGRAAAAAAGSSRRQPAALLGSMGAADGLQDWPGWPVEASRATRASSQLHRMADAVAGFRSDMDAAARQPFRPPR